MVSSKSLSGPCEDSRLSPTSPHVQCANREWHLGMIEITWNIDISILAYRSTAANNRWKRRAQSGTLYFPNGVMFLSDNYVDHNRRLRFVLFCVYENGQNVGFTSVDQVFTNVTEERFVFFVLGVWLYQQYTCKQIHTHFSPKIVECVVNEYTHILTHSQTFLSHVHKPPHIGAMFMCISPSVSARAVR